MQVWLNFALVVVLSFMVGVSITVNQNTLETSRRQDYIASHPDLAQEVIGALEKGKLTIGMAPEQVLTSWSLPAHIEVMEGHPDMEFWTYPKALVLFDQGAVKEWVFTRSKYDTGKDLARRFQYVLANGQLGERTATLIQKGAITTGMTPNEVQASWGEPLKTMNLYDDTLGESTVWIFDRGRNHHASVSFQEGEVLSWSGRR